MAGYPQTIYVNASEEKEIKIGAGKARRLYLFLQNASANDIYLNLGTHADAQNGTTLLAGLFYERTSSDGSGKGVPQGTIWVRGSQAAPARQQINLEEEFS